jgi:hypothetical protein
MASGWQKEKNILHANKKQKKKRFNGEKKNAYLQAIACNNHCNGHDDDLVATKKSLQCP